MAGARTPPRAGLVRLWVPAHIHYSARVMEYLDATVLEGLDDAHFQQQTPYPWVNPQGVIRKPALDRLLDHLPPIASFEKRVGETRRYGQQPHDRYALEYRPGLPLAPPWVAFIKELQSPQYMAFLERMLGCPTALSFHWHYTPTGCSVSPHCDAIHKLGSHIFYLNRDSDWKPEWGGQTVVLDDAGRFNRRSAPQFDDFERQHEARADGNRSFLFARRGNSWHGIREIRCPESELRKVFIVVLNRVSLVGRLARGRWKRRRAD